MRLAAGNLLYEMVSGNRKDMMSYNPCMEYCEVVT